MLENFGGRFVATGEKIQAKIQHVTHQVENTVIQGGDAMFGGLAASPTGSGKRSSNARDDEEDNSRGNNAATSNARSDGHKNYNSGTVSSPGGQLHAKIQHVTRQLENAMMHGADVMLGAVAASPTGSGERRSSARDDDEDKSNKSRGDHTSNISSFDHGNSDITVKSNVSAGGKMQAKIQHVTHQVEDVVKHGADAMFGPLAASHPTGSGNRRGNARDGEEENSRSIQHSHISVESNMSGDTEVRLRSEKSIRSIINSSVKELTSSESREPIDVALTLLRVITSHDASSKNLKLQIKVSDDGEGEGGEPPDLDVTIQVVQDKTDSTMILGGKKHCHKFSTFAESNLHLKLLSEEGNDEILVESVIPLRQLLQQPTGTAPVNRWVDLGQNKEGTSLGKIQLRLVPDLLFAYLHKLESCKVLTPGPEMALASMNSYALRKKALYSVAPVFLHVYDVSNDNRVQNCNYYFKAFGAGGIFHSSVEIYGKEYSFGGTKNRKSPVSGVFGCPPKRCPIHHYRESVYLGDCELTKDQVEGILNDLKPQWLARDYDLFRKNCCFFSQEFAVQLGVGNIPEWVYSLAETGQQFEPYIKAYFNRKKGAVQAAPKPRAISTPKPHSNAKETSLDHAMAMRIQRSFRKKKPAATGTLKPQANTNETMLDHAMASRIQRSFRKKKTTASGTSKLQANDQDATMLDHVMASRIQKSFMRKRRMAPTS